MQIRIFQINEERDVNFLKFLEVRPDDPRRGDPSIYDEVFCGEVPCMNELSLYAAFSPGKNPLFRGDKLSLKDVVLTEKGAFYLDHQGMVPVDFDVSRAHRPDDLLRIVYVEPDKPSFVSDIRNDLATMQKAVGGRIEPIYNRDGTILIANKESNLLDMDGNRRVEGSIIAGPFFVVGDNGEDFRSLTDNEVQRYMERFAQPEDISQEEVEEDSGFTLMAWK